MIVKSSAVPVRRVIVIRAVFPNMVLSGTASTGISWYDINHHNVAFPFDLANTGFAYKLGHIHTADSHAVNWPQAAHQVIKLQLFCVDSSGADRGGGTCLAEWDFTDGAGGTIVMQGALDATIQPAQSGPLTNACGIRFQYTVQNCTASLTLPSPLQIMLIAPNLISF